MEKFNCYGYYKPYTEEKCITQCVDCERKEILEKTDRGEIMMEVPMPVYDSKPVEKMYTKAQLFLFAGFCMARKRMSPAMDLGEILNEFNATFNHE